MALDDIVTWHQSYSVSIPLIDAQHVELIKLTNRLYRSCLTDRDTSKEVFMEVLHAAVNYVGYHFSTEENIMKKVCYPEFGAHKIQHTDFVREVLKTVDDIQNDIYINPLNFVKYLKDWILTHIAVTDSALGKYLVMLKNRGVLNSITLKIKNIDGRYVIRGDG